MAAQVRQVFANLGGILEGVGSTFSNVVEFTTYVVGRDSVQAYIAARTDLYPEIFPRRRLSPQHPAGGRRPRQGGVPAGDQGRRRAALTNRQLSSDDPTRSPRACRRTAPSPSGEGWGEGEKVVRPEPSRRELVEGRWAARYTLSSRSVGLRIPSHSTNAIIIRADPPSDTGHPQYSPTAPSGSAPT